MHVFRKTVIAAVLIALFPPRSSLELQVSSFSAAVQDLATGALGVERMQSYCSSLSYNSQYRDAATIAATLATQLENSFEAQKEAVFALKQRIELVYSNGDFLSIKSNTQCCHMNPSSLSQDFNFAVNVSRLMSCDKVSGQSGPGAQQESVYCKLIAVYTDNSHAPVKWAILWCRKKGCQTSYPAYKVDNCDSFDPRYRPWYTASATPNFKDVVVVVKNNRFINPDDYNTLIQAANILINTLNPRDRPSVDAMPPPSPPASPANIVKFQNFLFTAPDPLDGNNLFSALKAAFDYFSNDDISGSRSRAIVVFTDGERIDSSDDRDNIRALVTSNNITNISLFIFVGVPAQSYILSSVRSFYESLLPAAAVTQHHYVELRPELDLREEMQSFYSEFAARWTMQVESTFKPIFVPPYYKSGLDQLVISLAHTMLHAAKGTAQPGGCGCVDLSVSELLEGVEYFQGDSMTYAFHHRSGTIGGTPFFLCVVNPGNIDFKNHQRQKSFALPIQAQYHRLDLLGSDPSNTCSHFNSKVNPAYSTVHLSPWAFAKPNEYLLGQETAQTAKYIQTAMQKMSDPKQCCRRDPGSSGSHSQGELLVDIKPILSLRGLHCLEYIATPTGGHEDLPRGTAGIKGQPPSLTGLGKVLGGGLGKVLGGGLGKVLGGGLGKVQGGGLGKVQGGGLGTDEQWPIRVLVLSTPHPDVLGTRNVITFSQAIVSKSCNEGPQDYNCSVLAVMGMDITYPSLTRLLRNTTPLCQDGSYRCMIIDGNGYLIAHESFDGTGNEQYVHISEREPLLSQDMLLGGYLEKSYCYSFQYDDNFTKRPRRKYSYGDQQSEITAPLHGGYSTYCVFYSIAPISLTNGYLIVVDQKKTDLSLCSRSISCTCNVVCVAVLRGNEDSFAGTDGNWTHESPGGTGDAPGTEGKISFLLVHHNEVAIGQADSRSHSNGKHLTRVSVILNVHFPVSLASSTDIESKP
eukprot:Em0024g139a